ncbi:hypothetical protein [Luteimonas suaedae]|uniref:hypothetical protein n=1 Tax=Luteimonas suaedae TaxID=2605430 RepID=UPI0011EF17FB|nr:hypothetical protein [Luteimonas suaedae]
MKSLAMISTGLLLSLFGGLVLAAQGGPAMMRDAGVPYGGMGVGMMVVCIVFGVLVLVALVLGILALIKYLRSKP